MEIKVLAPAKINLMLDVTGKRSDGYHTLITIMQSISLADVVTISTCCDNLITVTTDNASIPFGKKNIAYKAAEQFILHTGIQHNGFKIHIQKIIPSEAGLGGGSADAAAVLIGLNALFKTKLSIDTLCDIGVKIGADVPFCIKGGTKFCTGIGEVMTDTFPLENCYIVISKGNSGISTKDAFKKIDAIDFEYSKKYTLYNGSVESVKQIGYNKFELVSENTDVEFIKNKMFYMNALYSAMSGSGSAVFGLFFNKTDADKCAETLSAEGFFSELCFPITNGTIVI